MPKRIKKHIVQKIVLRLPDLDHAKSAVLNSLSSPRSRRNYKFAMEQFITWYCSEPRLALNRAVVLRFRLYLESLGLAAGTINQRLAAVRRLAYEASDSGLLSPELAAGIRRVKGVKQLGFRTGNWLNREQARLLLEKSDGDSLRSIRDVAMISILLGCGLRRAELSGLRKEDIQVRQGHWAIVDLVGKGKHVRTVPMPIWVKDAVDRWLTAASVATGRVFRAVSRHGTPWGTGISENVVWYVIRNCAQRLELDHLAPHDLRRTCAKLCHVNGGELEQIQFLLGHASVLTTERYLGCKQNLEEPVNDRFGSLDIWIRGVARLYGRDTLLVSRICAMTRLLVRFPKQFQCSLACIVRDRAMAWNCELGLWKSLSHSPYRIRPSL